MRTRKPPAFTNLQDPNQLTELNNFLADVHALTNGRYTLENLTTDPQDTRKGQKGDLVYATFGGNDHLCVNTSFPAGFEWTCVNVGTLATCPGGADGQVQFNDNGDCGGDTAFLWEKNLNSASIDTDGTATINGDVNIGEYWGDFTGNLVSLDVRNTQSSGNGIVAAILGQNTITNGAGANFGKFGILGSVSVPSTDTTSWSFAEVMSGVFGTTDYAGSNASSSLQIHGVEGQVSTSGSGAVSVAAALKGSFIKEGSAAIDGLYGLYIEPPNKIGADGLYADTFYSGYFSNFFSASTPEKEPTDRFGLWVEGELHNKEYGGFSVFQGAVDIGGGVADYPAETPGTYVPTLNVDTDNSSISLVTGEIVQFQSGAATMSIASGTTLANERWNQFLAPTINGVSGGATETVTDAATVYIDAAPSGSNITIGDSADLMFGESTSTVATIEVQDESSANTAGRGFKVEGADGNGSGQGGAVELYGGKGGATGLGGSVNLIAGDGGSTSGVGGTATVSGGFSTSGAGGSVILDGGNAGGVSNRDGGDVFLQTGGGVSGGSNGTVFLFFDSTTSGSEEENVLFWSNANTTVVGLADGTTLTNNRFNIFDIPRINGVAGGSTETITNAATVYVEGAPTGSNITFTNGPYAFWSDAGRNRFDGFVDMFASATVTGILTVDGSTITNDISTGFGAVELAAGVWTPTTNNIANFGSSSAAEGQYIRVGSVVTGSVQLTVDPTLSATSTELELDLPVASNFGATSDAAGSCGGSDVASEVAEVRADATSDELEILWVTTSLASHEISCAFSYEIK